MKKYNVYGIGHALVDVECHVEDHFLLEAGLAKGSMTLVDQAQQHKLMAQLEGRQLHRSCGGSASNTMIGLAQLGGRGFHSCKIASDETGHFFAADLKANGVDNALTPSHNPPLVTGRCLVMISPDAERTMCTHLGISETFSVENLSQPHLVQAEYLYAEGYLVSDPRTRHAAVMAMNMAREAGVKTALTFSDVSMIEYFRPGLEEIIGKGVDLLFCNEQEALRYAQTDSLEVAKKRLKEITKAFCLTLGAQGASIFCNGMLVDIQGVKAKAVDTNGAGDLFAGAFLYGLTNGLSPEQSGKLAAHASALLVTQYGARLQPKQALDIKTSSGVDHA